MTDITVTPERYVLLPLAAAVTGYSEKAIRRSAADDE